MFKHQEDSYRNQGGQRFVCFEDVCDESKGDLRWQAREIVRALKEQGRVALYRRQDGFYRVFVAQ